MKSITIKTIVAALLLGCIMPMQAEFSAQRKYWGLACIASFAAAAYSSMQANKKIARKTGRADLDTTRAVAMEEAIQKARDDNPKNPDFAEQQYIDTHHTANPPRHAPHVPSFWTVAFTVIGVFCACVSLAYQTP